MHKILSFVFCVLTSTAQYFFWDIYEFNFVGSARPLVHAFNHYFLEGYYGKKNAVTATNTAIHSKSEIRVCVTIRLKAPTNWLRLLGIVRTSYISAWQSGFHCSLFAVEPNKLESVVLSLSPLSLINVCPNQINDSVNIEKQNKISLPNWVRMVSEEGARERERTNEWESMPRKFIFMQILRVPIFLLTWHYELETRN